MRKMIFGCLVAVAVLAFVAAPAARADKVTYTINKPNDDISSYTGPYATVEVNLTGSTTATITFASLTNGGNIYLMGANEAVDVNVNATTWTLGTITGSNAGTGFSPGPWSDDGSNNVSEFGVFNQTVDSSDGYTHSSDTISFTLTNTSSTWADAASVLKANDKGYQVAAHIFVTRLPANASQDALKTGFAGGGPVQVVPLPAAAWSTLGLFGAIGLGRVLRRKTA